MLAKGYYVILTRRSNHLSSMSVTVLTFLKTGKVPRYTHALMNCDNITDPNQRDGFKFVEAKTAGVSYSTFSDVFNCDAVCLLSLRDIPEEDLADIVDKMVKSVGTPYDDLFDLSDHSKMSCVELVWVALQDANRDENFPQLQKMIKDVGNLTPQMFRDCSDFVPVFEKVL